MTLIRRSQWQHNFKLCGFFEGSVSPTASTASEVASMFISKGMCWSLAREVVFVKKISSHALPLPSAGVGGYTHIGGMVIKVINPIEGFSSMMQ